MSGKPDEFIHLDCPRCGAPLQMEGDNLNCQYCGARLILKRSITNPQNTSGGNIQDAGTVIDGLRLLPFSYYDPQTGLEAFSILVPQGWQLNGGVSWVLVRPSAPAQISFQLVNPNGFEFFEVLPTLYFTWTNNPLVRMTMPVGSLYFGFEVRQPVDARQAMRQFVLPRCRGIPGLMVVDEGPALGLLQGVSQNQSTLARSAAQYSNDSARLRLRYTLNNQPMAEEMSGVAEFFRVVTSGMFSTTENIFWNIGYLTSFRASAERLESFANLYRAIIVSMKINPAWTAMVQQVSQGLSNNTIQHINQIGAFSRQLSRNYAEVSEMNLSGWQQRSAANDRESRNFSQYIRGVDPYYDPNSGRTVELPSGYTQAWSTPLGEYILADDPNFNPNLNSTLTWTPLSPPQPE